MGRRRGTFGVFGWAKRKASVARHKVPLCHSYRRALRFEPLEERRVLVVVTVSNLSDVVNGDTSSIAALMTADGGDGIAPGKPILEAASNTPVASGPDILLSRIGGFVYFDRDNDGVKDATEGGIENVVVTLSYSLDGQAVTVVAHTNRLGYYEFVDLAPNDYQITEQTPAGTTDGFETPSNSVIVEGNDTFRSIIEGTQSIVSLRNNFGEAGLESSFADLLIHDLTTATTEGLTLGGNGAVTEWTTYRGVSWSGIRNVHGSIDQDLMAVRLTGEWIAGGQWEVLIPTSSGRVRFRPDSFSSFVIRVVGRTTDLDIVGESTLPLGSDYNRNGAVGAADYVLWRKTENMQVASHSGADGNGNGTIEGGDYDLWRQEFGGAAPLATRVSNLAEQTNALLGTFGLYEQASSFLVDNQLYAYALQNITVFVSASQNGARARLRVYRGSSSGAPADTVFADLGEQTLVAGEQQVTFSSNWLPLLYPSSTYFVALSTSGDDVAWNVTTSTAESSSDDWVIGDAMYRRDLPGTTWNAVDFGPATESGLFSVTAYEVPLAAVGSSLGQSFGTDSLSLIVPNESVAASRGAFAWPDDQAASTASAFWGWGAGLRTGGIASGELGVGSGEGVQSRVEGRGSRAGVLVEASSLNSNDMAVGALAAMPVSERLAHVAASLRDADGGVQAGAAAIWEVESSDRAQRALAEPVAPHGQIVLRGSEQYVISRSTAGQASSGTPQNAATMDAALVAWLSSCRGERYQDDETSADCVRGNEPGESSSFEFADAVFAGLKGTLP